MKPPVTLYELPAFMVDSQPRRAKGHETHGARARERGESNAREVCSRSSIVGAKPALGKLHRLGALIAFGAAVLSFVVVTCQGARTSPFYDVYRLTSAAPADPVSLATAASPQLATKPKLEQPSVDSAVPPPSQEALAAQELRALRSAAQGRSSEALLDYQQLSSVSPDRPALKAAAHILEQKLRKQEERSQ